MFADLPHALLVDVARKAIALEPADALAKAQLLAIERQRRLLQPVINATGVLLHTNLGRAPLPDTKHTDQLFSSTIRASNLEFDLQTGTRGSRRTHASELLAQLCGAEAALVVNNCAGALVLVLSALAQGKGVLVSRGELVEIGGGFRIPDVLESSGARLVEVGTTNRTRLADYASAMDRHGRESIALSLKVHQSNYRIQGFTEETTAAELATLGLPVVADIGSGLLDERLPWLADRSGKTPDLPWLRGEPGAKQSLASGADLIVFSGDKLLGGPQAGVIAGRRDLVEACAKHPLARALRPGGLVLNALQNTLLAYLRNDARSLPFWDMATRMVEALQRRAESIVSAVADVKCTSVAMQSVPGGGTLPDRSIDSWGISLSGNRGGALRSYVDVPIVARTASGKTFLDLRTVDPADDTVLVDAIRVALTAKPSNSEAAPEHGGDDGGE